MSIRRKMLVLIAGFLLVTLVLTFGSYVLTGRSVRVQVEDTGRTMVAEIASAMDEYVAKLLSLTGSLAVSLIHQRGGDPDYVELFGRYLEAAQTHGVQTVFMGFESKEFADSTAWEPPEGYDPDALVVCGDAEEKRCDGHLSICRPDNGELIVSVTAPVRSQSGMLLECGGAGCEPGARAKKSAHQKAVRRRFPIPCRQTRFSLQLPSKTGRCRKTSRFLRGDPAELAEIGEGILERNLGLSA